MLFRSYKAIQKLYTNYNKKLQEYSVSAEYRRMDKFASHVQLLDMNDNFRKECDIICQNKYSLCDILLDLCYTKSATKNFAWNICGTEIIHNLLANNNHTLSFPTRDNSGDICYRGSKFKMISKEIEVDE